MDKLLIKQLEIAKRRTNCEKNFTCLKEVYIEPCFAKYHAVADMLECTDPQMKSCKFSAPFARAYACTCPLRKFLALNLEKLISKSD